MGCVKMRLESPLSRFGRAPVKCMQQLDIVDKDAIWNTEYGHSTCDVFIVVHGAPQRPGRRLIFVV
jgi:hypothetical protein